MSLDKSRDDDFLSNPKVPFRLLVRPPELLEATLTAVERRGPGSVLIVPNTGPSSGTLTDEYESLDAGRADESFCLLKGLNLGDLGDFGDGGALAMRMTGDSAASSGCKNGLSAGSGSSR